MAEMEGQPTGAVVSNESSIARKRALRRLSREEHTAYSALYEQVVSQIPGLTRHQVRGRTWTRLRYEFPDRYLELYALERGGVDADIPPDIRSKSWQRATARLAELREPVWRARYAEFREQGMSTAKAYDRAIAVIREANADLFARLLTEEYGLWLAVSSDSVVSQ